MGKTNKINNKHGLPKRVTTIQEVIDKLKTNEVQLIRIIAEQVKQNTELAKRRY